MYNRVYISLPIFYHYIVSNNMIPVEDFKIEFGLIVVGSIIFIASFMWKDLLMEIQEKYFPKTSGLYGRIFFTTMVTILLVMLAVAMRKLWNLPGSPTNEKEIREQDYDHDEGTLDNDEHHDINHDNSRHDIGHDNGHFGILDHF